MATLNWSTPGVNKPTLVERLWTWLMLALMIGMGAIIFTAAMLIHDARAGDGNTPGSTAWKCDQGDQAACAEIQSLIHTVPDRNIYRGCEDRTESTTQRLSCIELDKRWKEKVLNYER